MSADLSARIANLERQVRTFKIISALCGATVIIAICSLFNFRAQAQSSDRVLRVRGIIVEDAAGHERILIGAPVPAAQNRVRTDEARVRQLWATRYPNPERYMHFYKDYQHSTNGILILDEKGFDRVALGDPVPDPNIGKRIGPSTGMVINDEQGFERFGNGLLKVDNHYRVNLGMDSNQGTEALSLSVRDEGGVGISINDKQQTLYAGTAPASRRIAGADEPFSGFLVKDANGLKSITASQK